MDKVGDCSWAEIPTAKLRLRTELTPEGWTYSACYLDSKKLLILPQAHEEQAQHMAERWAIGQDCYHFTAR